MTTHNPSNFRNTAVESKLTLMVVQVHLLSPPTIPTTPTHHMRNFERRADRLRIIWTVPQKSKAYKLCGYWIGEVLVENSSADGTYITQLGHPSWAHNFANDHGRKVHLFQHHSEHHSKQVGPSLYDEQIHTV